MLTGLELLALAKLGLELEKRYHPLLVALLSHGDILSAPDGCTRPATPRASSDTACERSGSPDATAKDGSPVASNGGS